MSYKVTYFDMAGRGEPARLILAAAGVRFEDVRITLEDWPAQKSKYPNGQLPVLQCGDKTLTQSRAMFRHLARKFKFAGSDEWEMARCDEMVDWMEEIYIGYVDYYWEEKDATKKEEMKKVYIDKTLPAFLTKLNKIQAENGGTWLIGKNMTWADIIVAEYLRQLSLVVEKPSLLNEYANLKKMQDAVFEEPNIKAFNRCTGI